MEVFNPNPIVFIPTKSRQNQFAKPHSLWLDDADNERTALEGDDESNKPEEIDQDEIFGGHLIEGLTKLDMIC